MTSLYSLSSYRDASQLHTSYITSLLRYGLLDNLLFQEYLTKIYYISLYVIIFTSLHYYHRTTHSTTSTSSNTNTTSTSTTRHNEEVYDTFALPITLLKYIHEESKKSTSTTSSSGSTSSGTSSCLYEEDIIRLWESYNGIMSYMETMMKSGDNKELFMRLNFNQAWSREGSSSSSSRPRSNE